MSANSHSSVESDSSSDVSDSNTLDEWEERVHEQNHQIDSIIEDMLLNNPNLIVGAQNSTSKKGNDCTGRKAFSPLQKCTGAMRVLAYGISANVVDDEYLRMSATVTRDAIIHFVEGVISCFGDTYLRQPNKQDLERLLFVGEQRGFPGMIGRSGKPTIILEAVASYDLWIWHAFFGTPSSCNDINVLDQSPVFSDILEGRAPKVSYIVNGRQNNRAYYLIDGIYPSWAAFVKSIRSPMIRKHKLFAQHQVVVRKDVERAFGVLQTRFAFIRRPCLVWDKVLMRKIMMACIIIHNMIVETERDTYQNYYDPTEFLMDVPSEGDAELPQYSTAHITSLSTYMINRDQLRNREAHSAVQNDLIEHIWEKFGTNN